MTGLSPSTTGRDTGVDSEWTIHASPRVRNRTQRVAVGKSRTRVFKRHQARLSSPQIAREMAAMTRNRILDAIIQILISRWPHFPPFGAPESLVTQPDATWLRNARQWEMRIRDFASNSRFRVIMASWDLIMVIMESPGSTCVLGHIITIFRS